MYDKEYETWQRERDFIDEEMRRLMSGVAPETGVDCRIRRAMFSSLVEQREAAARRLMAADRARYREKWRRVTAPVAAVLDIASSLSQDTMQISSESIRL